MSETGHTLRKKKTSDNHIILLWEHIVYAMFLMPESDTASVYIKEGLKINITRSFDGENIHYDGLLMRNIPVMGKDDWRVAASLVTKADFSCTGELELFDNIINLLEQLEEMKVSFYILSPKKKKVLISMQFTQIGL